MTVSPTATAACQATALRCRSSLAEHATTGWAAPTACSGPVGAGCFRAQSGYNAWCVLCVFVRAMVSLVVCVCVCVCVALRAPCPLLAWSPAKFTTAHGVIRAVGLDGIPWLPRGQ